MSGDPVAGDVPAWPNIADNLAVDPTAFIHRRAYVGGTVTIGPDSSVWPMAVLRGDEGAITIGARSNVQDGCVIHAEPEHPVVIGDDCSLGHGAIVHGARLENNVLIGIGAIVLNGAHIGSGSIVAAGALVPEGMQIPPGSIVMGVPGKVRPLRPEQAARIRTPAEHYVQLKRLYQARGDDREVGNV
ncbi:MAG TPA: gamma carbonic anhydrase family protein [Herpetosiphonaceae bacterium]|nr:gamma carbonic anhydrase family protein [Herpetosiphonaceae bacterium]